MPNKASWVLWLEKGRASLCRARSGATHRPFPGSEKRNAEQWKTLVFKKRNNRIEKKGDILSREGPFWGPLQAPDGVEGWLEDPRCSPEPFIDLENTSTWCGAMGPERDELGKGRLYEESKGYTWGGMAQGEKKRAWCLNTHVLWTGAKAHELFLPCVSGWGLDSQDNGYITSHFQPTNGTQ